MTETEVKLISGEVQEKLDALEATVKLHKTLVIAATFVGLIVGVVLGHFVHL